MSEVESDHEPWTMAPTRLVRSSDFSPTEKLIYLAIRSYTSENTDQRISWPGRERIAADVGCSVRTVSRTIPRLEKAGWLTVEQRPGGSHRYVVHHRTVGTSGPVHQRTVGTPCPVHPGHDVPYTRDTMSREQEVVDQEPQKKNGGTTPAGSIPPGRHDATFSALWVEWPRREGHYRAWRAWSKLLREFPNSKNDAIEAILNYARAPRSDRETKFTYALSTFLEDKIWLDWTSDGDAYLTSAGPKDDERRAKRDSIEDAFARALADEQEGEA